MLDATWEWLSLMYKQCVSKILFKCFLHRILRFKLPVSLIVYFLKRLVISVLVSHFFLTFSVLGVEHRSADMSE